MLVTAIIVEEDISKGWYAEKEEELKEWEGAREQYSVFV